MGSAGRRWEQWVRQHSGAEIEKCGRLERNLKPKPKPKPSALPMDQVEWLRRALTTGQHEILEKGALSGASGWWTCASGAEGMRVPRRLMRTREPCNGRAYFSHMSTVCSQSGQPSAAQDFRKATIRQNEPITVKTVSSLRHA